MAFAGLCLLAAAAAPACAADLVSELRGAALAHDVGGPERGVDVSGEVVFVSPVPQSWSADLPSWIRWALHPQPTVGVQISTAGQTDQLYAGLSWTAGLAGDVLAPRDSLFISVFGGGSGNDGDLDHPTHGRAALGSNLMFREAITIGYRDASGWEVFGTASHTSNAGLADRNQGLSSVGLGVGFAF